MRARNQGKTYKAKAAVQCEGGGRGGGAGHDMSIPGIRGILPIKKISECGAASSKYKYQVSV